VQNTDITVETKTASIREGGHVIRMRDSEIPETVLSYRPQGKRRVGRPEVRWTDVVNNDMRKAGVRD
jgi:hypothetical protein